MHSFKDDDAFLFGGGEELSSFLGSIGEGLLDQHMFSGLHRAHGPLKVQTIRQLGSLIFSTPTRQAAQSNKAYRVVYRINIRVRDQLCQVLF